VDKICVAPTALVREPGGVRAILVSFVPGSPRNSLEDKPEAWSSGNGVGQYMMQ